MTTRSTAEGVRGSRFGVRGSGFEVRGSGFEADRVSVRRAGVCCGLILGSGDASGSGSRQSCGALGWRRRSSAVPRMRRRMPGSRRDCGRRFTVPAAAPTADAAAAAATSAIATAMCRVSLSCLAHGGKLSGGQLVQATHCRVQEPGRPLANRGLGAGVLLMVRHARPWRTAARGTACRSVPRWSMTDLTEGWKHKRPGRVTRPGRCFFRA
jgi:hypothetical protein